MKKLADCRLYGFVDAAYLDGRDPRDVASALCDGGADIIQLRAKEWSAERIERTAAALMPVCEMNNVLFVVNDHPKVAARLRAPLVHLGQEDFFGGGKNHIFELGLGTRVRVGLSSHSPQQAQQAVAAGAAYIAVGPVFPTPTKPGRPAVTLSYVTWAANHLGDAVWFAIGGINLTNLDEVLEAGARRVCVVSDILKAKDVAVACREYRRRLDA